MRRVIRIGVFETNSSSQHSFAYINKELFEKWKNGECYIDFGAISHDFENAIPDLGAVDALKYEVSLEEVEGICSMGKQEYEEMNWNDFDRDAYLVRVGVLPFEIFSQEDGEQVASKWANAGGGITYAEKEYQPDGGVTVFVERYDW